MFMNFFARRAQKRREQSGDLADAVMRRLELEPRVVVDDAFAAGLGVGSRSLFRAIYSLVMRERIHLLDDGDGGMILMSNAEFHRFMLRRSEAHDAATPERGILPVFAEALPDSGADYTDAAGKDNAAWIVLPAVETFEVEPQPPLEDLDSTLVSATLGGSPLSGVMPEESAQPGWFAADRDRPLVTWEKHLDARQNLPNRRREPWPAGEEAEVSFD